MTAVWPVRGAQRAAERRDVKAKARHGDDPGGNDTAETVGEDVDADLVRVEDRPWTQNFACADKPLGRSKRKVSSRGWLRWGGGPTGWIHPVPEWQVTTVQGCGLWMGAVIPANPAVGCPSGEHEQTQETVCVDPNSWFEGGIISSPSGIIFGLNGLGKSSLVKRWIEGWSYQNVISLVASDVKGEYVILMRKLGGSVVSVGQGQGSINVLDIGSAWAAADRLEAECPDRVAGSELARKVRTQAADTRNTVICGLLAISRGTPLIDWERGLLATALEVLDETIDPGPAVMADLVAVVEAGSEQLRDQVAAKTDPAYYTDFVRPLVQSLKALSTGSLGKTFAGRDTIPIDITRPLTLDISGIGKQDSTLRAAVMLACWGKIMLDVEVRHTLADGGLERRQRFALVLEEMWHILSASSGMVSRLNELTRLNRTIGTAQVFLIHSLADLQTLPTEADRRMAEGFAERCGIMCIFGVPQKELAPIRDIVRLSDFEAARLVGWSVEASIDPRTGKAGDPPGLGRYLLKAGSRPGVAVRFRRLPVEAALHNTSNRWEGRG